MASLTPGAADVRTVGIARRLDLVTTAGVMRIGIDGEPHGRDRAGVRITGVARGLDPVTAARSRR